VRRFTAATGVIWKRQSDLGRISMVLSSSAGEGRVLLASDVRNGIAWRGGGSRVASASHAQRAGL